MTEHEPAEDGTRAPEGSPRWVFGQMIKFFRVKAGLTQDQLGERVHVSGKTIASYEKGWRVPPRKVAELLDAVPELATNGALCELWRQFEDAMKYYAYPSVFQPWWERLAGVKRIRWYEQCLVPGFLQTEGYTRAMGRSQFGTTGEEIDELVARRHMQREVLRQPHPPAFWVIMEEGALHRPVGGPHVMAQQVKRLIDAAGQTSIRIEIIGSTAGGHSGLSGGGFQIVDFEGEPSVGGQECTVRRQEIRDHKDLAVMEFTWDALTHETESRASSLVILEKMAKSWDSAL